MTARKFLCHVSIVVLVYLIVMAAALALSIFCPENKVLPYRTFRDMIPLMVAIPASWLVYCFQQRQAYLYDVRTLWTKMVAATQEAIQYTHLVGPDQQAFASVNKSLSSAIDELRGVFMNLGEPRNSVGLYPFEGMKTILEIVNKLGYGESVTKEKSKAARSEIIYSWKKLRRSYLSECARGVPAQPDSPFLLD